jgi:hypothetical protein
MHVFCMVLSLKGYVVDDSTGKPLRYRLNGLRCMVAVALLWVACFVHLPQLATLAVERIW